MFDFVLVGGGLQNALIAVALCQRAPKLRLALVEREPCLGGNHTWCFHDGDVGASARDFVEPFVVHRWPGYTVHFPGLQRQVNIGYSAITSERLHRVVVETMARTPGCQLLCGRTARRIEADAVVLDDGTRLSGRMVVDARGPSASTAQTGYQKFLGREIVTEGSHGVQLPVLMDAVLPQRDGYRFLYVLPFSERRLLVEETFFSDSPALDERRVGESLAAYINSRGWRVSEVVRAERGVLPMPWAGAYSQPANGPLRAGYRGGFFHPATGYSLPVAVRVADCLSRTYSGQFFAREMRALQERERRQRKFAYTLNKMLFRWFPGPERRHVFERFYRLPEATIRRFYSLQLTNMDRVRLFWGRPPKGISWRAMALGGDLR